VDTVLVTDVTTDVSFPLAGIFTASTGPASAFVVTSGFVLGTFTAGGSDSVLIIDPTTMMPIVSGIEGGIDAVCSTSLGASCSRRRLWPCATA
jgi:hypothetical protein